MNKEILVFICSNEFQILAPSSPEVTYCSAGTDVVEGLLLILQCCCLRPIYCPKDKIWQELIWSTGVLTVGGPQRAVRSLLYKMLLAHIHTRHLRCQVLLFCFELTIMLSARPSHFWKYLTSGFVSNLFVLFLFIWTAEMGSGITVCISGSTLSTPPCTCWRPKTNNLISARSAVATPTFICFSSSYLGLAHGGSRLNVAVQMSLFPAHLVGYPMAFSVVG